MIRPELPFLDGQYKAFPLPEYNDWYQHLIIRACIIISFLIWIILMLKRLHKGWGTQGLGGESSSPQYLASVSVGTRRNIVPSSPTAKELNAAGEVTGSTE